MRSWQVQKIMSGNKLITSMINESKVIQISYLNFNMRTISISILIWRCKISIIEVAELSVMLGLVITQLWSRVSWREGIGGSLLKIDLKHHLCGHRSKLTPFFRNRRDLLNRRFIIDLRNNNNSNNRNRWGKLNYQKI